MSQKQSNNKNGKHSRLWVPLVLLIGTIIGIISYIYLYMTSLSLGPGPVFGGPFGPYEFLQFHSILSTISISLLVALLVVYGGTYQKTRANFILGLIVVLLALLLQNLTQYPLLHQFVDNSAFESVTFSSPVSDVFTIIAYSVFLYLSLE